MELRKTIITGVLLAIGIILARFLHLLPLPLPAFMFSPLHLPVFICALICGRRYGIICGIILPYLSFAVSKKPPLYPAAIAMSIELLVYAAVAGTIFKIKLLKANVVLKAFVSILIAQIIGRLAGGLATAMLLGFNGKPYLFETFVTSYFVQTLPAIILQLVIIPPLVKATMHYQEKSA